MCVLGLTGCVAIGFLSEGRATARDDSAALPLVHSEDLIYQGGFRVPVSMDDQDPVKSAFAFGGEALTYWPAHQSLLMSNLYSYVGEISIPSLVNSSNLADMNRATFLQQPTDILQGKRRTVDGDSGNGALIGGMMLRGTDLIADVYDVYDSSQSQSKSHFVTGQNFSSLPAVTGPFQIGTTRFGGSTAGITSKWMVPVPTEFQAALGGAELAGNCCMSIISRTSIGPSVSVFNPADIGVTNPVPATVLLGYPQDHPTLGPWLGPGTSTYTMGTIMAGAVWPVGTRSVLFVGTIGTAGNNCYGLGTSDAVNSWPNARVLVPNQGTNIYCYTRTGVGIHGEFAYPYKYFIWAYDANDLVAVKNGKKHHWEVVPYATWSFELPIDSPSRKLTSVTYDPAAGRVFLAQYGVDVSAPVIQVFTLRLAPGSGRPMPGRMPG
jgi:hypothetical protein